MKRGEKRRKEVKRGENRRKEGKRKYWVRTSLFCIGNFGSKLGDKGEERKREKGKKGKKRGKGNTIQMVSIYMGKNGALH